MSSNLGLVCQYKGSEVEQVSLPAISTPMERRELQDKLEEYAATILLQAKAVRLAAGQTEWRKLSVCSKLFLRTLDGYQEACNQALEVFGGTMEGVGYLATLRGQKHVDGVCTAIDGLVNLTACLLRSPGLSKASQEGFSIGMQLLKERKESLNTFLDDSQEQENRVYSVIGATKLPAHTVEVIEEMCERVKCLAAELQSRFFVLRSAVLSPKEHADRIQVLQQRKADFDEQVTLLNRLPARYREHFACVTQLDGYWEQGLDAGF